MSKNSGIAPRESTGATAGTQCAPSVLRAKSRAAVVHDPGTFTLNVAQNSSRLGIHSTSICQGNALLSDRSVVTGSDQVIPSLDRRSSTAVALLVQPLTPLFTDHINQSPAERRTTVGETML